MLSLMFTPKGEITSLQNDDIISIRREEWGELPRIRVFRSEDNQLIRLEIGLLRKLEIPILQHESDLKWDPVYIASILGIKSKKLELLNSPSDDMALLYKVVPN